MNYNDAIKEVISALGGASNIAKHTNCMTRLRVGVKNTDAVNVKALENIEGVLGVKNNNSEIQLIFGPGKVTKAKAAMDEILGEASESGNQGGEDSFEDTIASQKAAVKGKRTTSFQGFMAKFSNIFVPLLPGFIAAGTMAGIAALLSGFNLFPELVAYLNLFNKSLLGFMYIMIGYNAAVAFGGTGVIGGILAGTFKFTYGVEGATSGMQEFFGRSIDPRGGIIGILIVVILGTYVERFIRKNLSWENTDIITTPILTLIVMSSLNFLLIMPASVVLYDAMNFAFKTLNSSILGAGVLAGLFLPSVMMGIHQGFVPVYQGLVETTGLNSLFPILAMAGAGQVGAALALYVKSPKHSKLRKNIAGAIIPGFLGIGEPLIYGVTLPRVKPFITAMLGGVVGGMFLGALPALFGTTVGITSVFGPSGLLAILSMSSTSGSVTGIILYLAALLVAYVAGFIFTILFGTKNVDLS